MDKKTLKEIRESKGITSKHICKLLNISRQSLYNKEHKRTSFLAIEVQKLCNEYGVDIKEIDL